MNKSNRLDKPYLLIFENEKDGLSVVWLKTEEDMIKVIKEVKLYGCTIITAMEIKSSRDVLIE